MSNRGDMPPGSSEFWRLAETLPQVVWSATAAGVIDRVSRDFFVESGLAPLEIADFAWLKAVHPDDRERVRRAWQATVATGSDYRIEFRIASAFGPDQWRWYLVTARALRDADGRIERWFGTTVDIHDRYLAEAALRERERYVRALLEAQPECVKTVTADGLILDMNPAGLALVEADTREDIVGRPLDAVLHPADRAAYWDMHRRVIAGATASLRFRIRGRRGTLRWVHTMASPLPRADGSIASAVCVTRDISQEQRERELHDAELRVLGRVSSGAPLADILDFVTRFVDGLVPDAMASVVLLDGARQLHMASAPRVPRAYCDYVEGRAISATCGTCGAAMTTRRTVVCHDIADDPAWPADLRAQALSCGLRAAWSTPLFVADREVAGTFALYYTTPHTPTAHEIAIIERVAHFLTVALERTREHARLLASEQRYRSVYQGVPVSIWEHDWSGVVAAVGHLPVREREALRAYFLTHPEVVASARRAIRLVDVNDVTLQMFAARDREEFTARRHEIFAPVGSEVFVDTLLAYFEGAGHYSAERDLATLDGRRLHVLMSIAFPPRDRAAQLVLVSLMDITARHAAERALVESETRFREIAETVSEAFWSADRASGEIRYMSPAYERIWGLPVAGLADNPHQWYEAVLPEDRPAWDVAMRDLSSDGTTVAYRIRRPDGEIRWIEDTVFGVLDADGAMHRYIGVAKDVTEHRRLEAQLREAQRLDAIGHLTGGIAHDFNNLLTVILGNVETLHAALETDDSLRPLVEMSQQAAQRGAELIQRLLAFARRQMLAPTPTDIRALLASMAPLLRRALGETIQLTIASGRHDVALIDPGQLENAVLNLCLNARDAMPGGGRVHIATDRIRVDERHPARSAGVAPGDYLDITVSDTGHGMDPETVARACEPFFTTKEPGAGSGLGLSMVYGFVHQSRGGVRIRSTPGAGTTVHLFLPTATLDAAAAAMHGQAVLERGRERILLVEDDPLVRKHVQTQLEHLGYAVEAVADGPSALDRLAADATFDLLFTDMVMPGGLNGLEVATQATQRDPALAVLFTSGYTGKDLLAARTDGTPLRLLQKPYRRQDLARAVRAALDGTAPS